MSPAEVLSRPGAAGPIFCPRIHSSSAKCLCPAFYCHGRISCDEGCRFGVVQDPEVRANESGFAMPLKECSDGAGWLLDAVHGADVVYRGMGPFPKIVHALGLMEPQGPRPELSP